MAKRRSAAAAKPGVGGSPAVRRLVRGVLRRRGVSAEGLLVGLLDVVVDSHVDCELRKRGLGPEGLDVPGSADVQTALYGALVNTEYEFGKGFGRRPAKGSVADVTAEGQRLAAGIMPKMTPVQWALRVLVCKSWSIAEDHLDLIDPPPPEEGEGEGEGNAE